MKPQAEMRRVEIIFDRPRCLPKSVYLDQDRFQQVLLNLITNAIKFTQDGKINIHCQAIPLLKPYKLYVEVEDTGIGIPKNKMSQLFKEFSKIEDSR
jgi:signal transduction histidine kinase